MTIERCPKCNGECVEQGRCERTAVIGEYCVSGSTPVFLRCTKCGKSWPALTFFDLQAVVVAFTGAPRVSGPMLRAARNALLLNQRELGKRIGSTLESVCRWECEKAAMPRWVPLAVLGLVRAKLMPPMRALALSRAS
jgi:hypothetical protein